MVEPITFQTVFQFLQTASIMVGITYYVLTLRNQRRNQEETLETRQAQLFMQIMNQFNTPERQKAHVEIMSWEWKDPEDFYERIWPDEEKRAKFMYFGWLLEGVGILVHKKLINVDLIDDLISAVVISYWERYRPVEVFTREKYNMPQNAEWLEYLYNEVVKVATDQHPELAGKTSTVWKAAP